MAEVNVTKGIPDLHTLRNLLEAEVRSVLDIIGYQHGLSFDVEIISASHSTSDDKVIFGINIPILSNRRKGAQLTELSADTLIAVGKEPHAQMVLADFREAMRNPTGTGFFCYRAIEAMMQSMRNGVDEKIAWQRMRERLRIERSAIDFIKDHADFPRHGRPSSISDPDRAKVFHLTDLMIERFFLFLKAGAQDPLDEKNYPSITL